MHAPVPALPAIVPSRRGAFAQALTKLESRHPVFITGVSGSGHTTFGQSLLASRAVQGRFVHRLTGSRALAEVPFATLAALAAQIPAPVTDELSATDSITAVATNTLSTPRTFFIDHAENVDHESAAAIAQLAPGVELIISTPNLAGLPPDLAKLAYEHGSHEVGLTSIDVDDARKILEDLLGAPCNSSTVNRLFNLSGGNPMYLRELTIDAERQESLPTLNGYRTLSTVWNPGGRRLVDLITRRLSDQPRGVREALNLLTLTGPLPHALTPELVTPDVLDHAISEGLLTLSAQHHTTDLAQTFDGPGAQQRLDHPEEMVQLGAGLTSDLVIATLSPTSLQRYGALITERLDDSVLPAHTRMHMRAVLETGDHSCSAAEARHAQTPDELAQIAARIAELTHSGRPSDGVQLFAEHIDTQLWHASSSADQTACIQAMFLAMIGEGSHLGVFDEHFVGIDWHDVSLDHSVFLTGRGDLFLELGNAAEATQMFAQSLGLLSMQDRTGLAGFTAGLDAVAAVMQGNLEHARTQYNLYLKSPATSGGFARIEAERLTLHVICVLEGTERASRALESLLAGAERQGQDLIVMRLLHDAWRLRLIKPEAVLVHLDRLSEVAHRVQGSFAELLSQYAHAFREVEHGVSTKNQRSEGLTAEKIATKHLESGRALFAAEIAARAAETALRIGDRRRASRLLAVFAEATPLLAGVNTPSLGRARIDPILLSEREVEVCLGAVQGKSNPEIAAELFLSPRTVEGHLQRAYNKLGITDRRQLLPLSKPSDDRS